jgi:broad specificity phosphatase PhoE
VPTFQREITVVRHGETVGESSVRLYGATDIELSNHGRTQMRKAGAALRDFNFDRLVVSPLRRSRESAAVLLGDAAPPSTVVEAFREIDFGNWEGWTVDEVAERNPVAHREWQRGDSSFTFPGGEARWSFQKRVRAAVPELLSDSFARALWVLHKGIIKVVMSTLLDIPREEARRLPVDLGSIHRLAEENGRWSLVGGDPVAHLGEDHIPDEATGRTDEGSR